MKMTIESLVCYFPWVTHLNLKTHFIEIMPQSPHTHSKFQNDVTFFFFSFPKCTKYMVFHM